MANLSVPTDSINMNIAIDTIRKSFESVIEKAILEEIQPSIKHYAKEAVAAYNDIRVHIQKNPDVMHSADQVLVTFVENVINKHYDSPTVVEERK